MKTIFAPTNSSAPVFMMGSLQVELLVTPSDSSVAGIKRLAEIQLQLGGGAGNAAKVLSGLGIRSVVASTQSGAVHSLLPSLLPRGCRAIVHPSEKAGITVGLSRPRNPTRLLIQRTAFCAPVLGEQAAAAASRAPLVLIHPLGDPTERVFELLARLRAATEAPVCLQLSASWVRRPVLRQLWAILSPTLVQLNASELAPIIPASTRGIARGIGTKGRRVGSRLMQLHSGAECLLNDLPVDILAVTNAGKAGLVLHQNGTTTFAPLPPSNFHSDCGAGDAFFTALSTSLYLSGQSVEVAIGRATKEACCWIEGFAPGKYAPPSRRARDNKLLVAA